MEATRLIDTLAQTTTLKTKLQQTLAAYQNLDYHLLNEVLDDDCLYEDMRKTSFVLQQKKIFDTLRKKGDTQMLLSTNICTGCLCSAPVFVLTGNNSGLKHALYFEFTGDVITDIFRCSEQSDWLEWMMPFWREFKTLRFSVKYLWKGVLDLILLGKPKTKRVGK